MLCKFLYKPLLIILFHSSERDGVVLTTGKQIDVWGFVVGWGECQFDESAASCCSATASLAKTVSIRGVGFSTQSAYSSRLGM